jgi:hypothetical protein
MSSTDRRHSRRDVLGGAAAVLGAAYLPAPPRSREPTAPEEILYSNPLASSGDVSGFRSEGDASVAFPDDRMRLSANRDPAEGQATNFVF